MCRTVLRHLSTLFNNTNAVNKLEQVDRLCTVYSAKQLRNPDILQIILTKYCQNSTTFFSLNDLL